MTTPSAEQTTLKAGTRVSMQVGGGIYPKKTECGRIARWSKVMGPREALPAGYHPVTFDTGGTLMVHESGFTVVAKKAAA